MSPDTSPTSDTKPGTVEAATPSYGASGASLANFRRKYGPVEHTPLKMKHSVSVGTDLFSPAPNSSRPGLKNSATSFDLWNAGGNDFPSPVKNSRREGSPMKTMYTNWGCELIIGRRVLLLRRLQDLLLGDLRLWIIRLSSLRRDFREGTGRGMGFLGLEDGEVGWIYSFGIADLCASLFFSVSTICTLIVYGIYIDIDHC